MDTLNRYTIGYSRVACIGWLVLVLVLAACNNGTDGGGPGY